MSPKHITLILGVLLVACGGAPTKISPTLAPVAPSATTRPTAAAEPTKAPTKAPTATIEPTRTQAPLATATRPVPTSTVSVAATPAGTAVPKATLVATVTARPTLAVTATRASTLAPRTGGGWMPVGEACPTDAPIKGNINSKKEKIYHRPGQQAYNTTKPEACFATAAEAEAAGFRAALR